MSSANQCPGGAIRANLALALGFGGLACRIIIRGGRGIMLGLTRLAFQLCVKSRNAQLCYLFDCLILLIV